MYSALIHALKTTLFMEKACAQLEAELKNLEKAQQRIADQAKSLISAAKI